MKKSFDVVPYRLASQRLIEPAFKKPGHVVAWLGAVQAQDWAAAKWSLGLRMRSATDDEIEKAFNQGEILRTHVMRPTWHFVMPEDVRWMQGLTASRVKALLASYNRKFELDDKLFEKSNAAIVSALRAGRYLTRQELKSVLAGIGIRTNVQRLAHIIIWAELDGLIVSGPRRGKQFTYALLEERAAKVKKISRDKGCAKLALRYFTSHGPAQLKDFVWWSGLAAKDAAEGLDSVKSQLMEETFDGKTYWFSPSTHTAKQKTPVAFLLSIYDEYTIAYKDRSALGGERYLEKLLAMGNALTAVLILDGRIVGTWRRVMKQDAVEIALRPFRKLGSAEKRALMAATNRYGAFLEMPVRVTFD